MNERDISEIIKAAEPFKLGKAPAKEDRRTLRITQVLRALPPYPDTYDVDRGLGLVIPPRMFANDRWGDCVIASRAHLTERFEGFEQGKIIEITDQEVLEQYWHEQGGGQPDNGLYMLDSLKKWRNEGWTAAGRHYCIYAFAALDQKNHAEVMASIYFFNGQIFGLRLPISAAVQLRDGLIWDVVADQSINQPGSWGLHALCGKAYKNSAEPSYYDIAGYNKIGPVCITWGKFQQMTWTFWDVYCDEAFAVLDNRNDFMGKDSPVNLALLDEYLADITGKPVPEPTPAPPSPSQCPIGNNIARLMNSAPRLLGRRGRFFYLNPK